MTSIGELTLASDLDADQAVREAVSVAVDNGPGRIILKDIYVQGMIIDNPDVVLPLGGRLRVVVRRPGEGIVPPGWLLLRDAKTGRPVGRFVRRTAAGYWIRDLTAQREAFLRRPVPAGEYVLDPDPAGPRSLLRRVTIEAGKTTCVTVSDREAP